MVLQDSVFLKLKKNSDSILFEFREEELNNNNSITIKENTICQLFFHGNENDRLYLDGLDLIDDGNDSRIKLDDKERIYIEPSNRPYDLYNYLKNDLKYLPGSYRLKLVTENSDLIFYSWLVIEPKFLSDSELFLMKNDIEETVNGLSKSFISNTNGVISENSLLLDYDDIKTIEILHNNYNSFKNMSFSLIDRPRTGIETYYHWMDEINGFLDRKSILQMSKRNFYNKVYGKDRRVTYSIPDNKQLKSELKYILDKINRLKFIIEKISSYNPKNKDLKIINNYKSMITMILNQKWMKDIQYKNSLSFTSNGNLDNRYSFFNKLYWKLNHISNFSGKFERQYMYYWKRTDLLYEIWGYIKVIEALNKLNFIPIKGWIYDNIYEDFKGLESGTTVELKSADSNTYIKVVYDDQIRAKSKNDKILNPDSPIYSSGKHNSPDILIKIYDVDMVFITSIVIDTKYRKIEDVLSFSSKGSSLDQLSNYSDSLHSPYPYRDIKYKRIKDQFDTFIEDTTAVIRVGVLYPKNYKRQNMDEFIPNKNNNKITSIELNPNNITLKGLLDFLEKCFSKYEKMIDQLNKLNEHIN